MRALPYFLALLVPSVVACESKDAPTPAPAGETSSRSAATASQAAPAMVSASAAASASAPAPTASAAEGPCPPNAKRYDEPRFCVVLGKSLDVSYEGDAQQGMAELEVRGDVLRFSWVPLARLGKESLEAQLERVSAGEELVGSGAIPGGAWSELRVAQKGKHVVQSAVTTQKLVINCHFTVDAEKAEEARAVCKSVRGY